MTDDPIQTLERELVSAARRAATEQQPARRVIDGRRRRVLRGGLAMMAVVVPVLIVLAVVLVAHSLSGDSRASGDQSAGLAPSVVLGVLRRPGARPTGQALATVQKIARTVRHPTVSLQRANLRQIAVHVAPGTTVPLDLAVVRASDGRRLIGLTVPAHTVSGQGEGESQVYLYADRADQAYSTVSQLRADGIGAWLGQDRGGTEDYAVLVPDGIARVRLNVPGDPVATVHHNVAGFRLSDVGTNSLSKQLGMTWLDAAGHVVHRVDGARVPGPARLHDRVNAAIRGLRAHLAVLRRRPTAADRAQATTLKGAAPPGMTLVSPSARVARTTSTAGPVVVAVVRDTADGTAGVLLQDANGGGCCTTPHELLRSAAISTDSSQQGANETLVLVPDGVHTITLHLRGRTISANVIDNIAIVSGSDQHGLSPAMTWYGADGQVLRRIPAPN